MNGFTLAGIGDEAGSGLADQVAALRTLGWSAIELRTVDRAALADLDDRCFDAVANTVREQGLATVCVDSRIGDWSAKVTDDFSRDLDELDVLSRRCEVLECGYIRVMSYPNNGLPPEEWARRVKRRLGELARRAEQSGVTLLHENCAGWAAEDADRMLELVADCPGLGLLFDTGNGVAHGYHGMDLLPHIVEHVKHVHIKDGFPGPEWTVPGIGEADIPGVLKTLKTSGYTGALSLEPHLSLRPHERDGRPGDRDGFHKAGMALQALLGPVLAEA